MKKMISHCAAILAPVMFSLLTSMICSGQTVSFRYTYQIAPAMVTEAPHISGGPEFNYPDDARKNGVEGKVVATFTLGEDAQVRNIKVVSGLPDGVNEALTQAVKKLTFAPAQNRGVPTAVEVTLELSIVLVFDEDDPAIKKPKITFLPTPVYPESQRAGNYKGKVSARMLFYADGTLEVDAVGSVLPKEFDNAAVEAAKAIKFQPAVHKKSQKPVSQMMVVEFDFKP